MATTYFQGTTIPYSEYADGIEGVKVTIDVVKNGTPVFTSLAMDNGSGTLGAMWGQIGYIPEIDNRGQLYNAPFYQVWNGGSLLIDKTDFRTKIADGEHTFEFSELRGTKWAFYLDDKKIGTVDMHDTEANAPSNTVSFTGTEYSSAITNTIDFSGFSVKTDGVWHTVSDAAWFTYGSPGTDTPTGAAGNLQDPSLPDGSWSQGAALPVVQPGTQLWSSADDAFAFSHDVVAAPVMIEDLLFAQAMAQPVTEDTFAFTSHPGADHASEMGLLGIAHYDHQHHNDL